MRNSREHVEEVFPLRNVTAQVPTLDFIGSSKLLFKDNDDPDLQVPEFSWDSSSSPFLRMYTCLDGLPYDVSFRCFCTSSMFSYLSLVPAVKL